MMLKEGLMTVRSVILLVVVLFSRAALHCPAKVWTTIYHPDDDTAVLLRDPNIPDVYVDIMVGTHLSIVVSSDAAIVLWAGRMGIEEPYDTVGWLLPCDYNELTYNPEKSESILPNALSMSGWGLPPLVDYLENSVGHLVDMVGTDDPQAGDWFVVDYHAIGLGECRIVFTEVAAPFSSGPDPIPGGLPPVFNFVSETVLTHVPTRDFDENHVVDFRDFALMAQHLQSSADNDPNMAIDPNGFAPEYDFDQSQSIDATDLSLFLRFWLERTSALSQE